MSFPSVRLQRYRTKPGMRAFSAEVVVSKKDLIAPLFIAEGLAHKREVASMPGVYQHTLDSLSKEVEELLEGGIQAVILFGIPLYKDLLGSSSYQQEGIIQRAIALLRERFPELVVMADCCLCEYTSHGHCGVWKGALWDAEGTLLLLQKIALSYAQAGVDIIAPSGSIDGMVRSIREALDASGFSMTAIFSYAVKYASCLYSPFREAAGSSGALQGDRKHHQLAPTQAREALREALLDEQEGADYLMVKPALSYLDIIYRLKEKTLLPLGAYQVSGEYAAIKAAAAAGVFDERTAFLEAFTALKRAGADWIFTYYAKQMEL